MIESQKGERDRERERECGCLYVAINKIDCINCCDWQQFNHNLSIAPDASFCRMPYTFSVYVSINLPPSSSQPSHHLKLIHRSVCARRKRNEQRFMFRELCSAQRKHTGNLNVAKTNFHSPLYSFHYKIEMEKQQRNPNLLCLTFVLFQP